MARDGIVKIWNIISSSDENAKATVQLVLGLSFSPFDGISVTSLDILSIPVNISCIGQSYCLIALGAENGDIQIWGIAEDFATVKMMCSVPAIYCHGATVHKLKWRANAAACDISDSRMLSSSTTSKLYLASCGEDRSVRVHVFEP